MAKEQSWKELVLIKDPDRNEKEDVYEFGGGQRKFKDRKDPYESASN